MREKLEQIKTWYDIFYRKHLALGIAEVSERLAARRGGTAGSMGTAGNAVVGTPGNTAAGSTGIPGDAAVRDASGSAGTARITSSGNAAPPTLSPVFTPETAPTPLSPFPAIWESEERFKLNMELKYEHTLRVVRRAGEIAASLCGKTLYAATGEGYAFNETDVALAVIIAYLHDAGRFYQLRRSGTFSDITGENHAELSVRAIRDEGLDKWFCAADLQIIETSVALHNIFHLDLHTPPLTDARTLAHARLIRDADKLDIFKITTDEAGERRYTLDHEERTGRFSDELVRDVLAHKSLSYQSLKSKEDWVLLSLGMIFDINYPCSFAAIRAGRFAEKLLNPYIGQHPQISDIIESVNIFVRQGIE